MSAGSTDAYKARREELSDRLVEHTFYWLNRLEAEKRGETLPPEDPQFVDLDVVGMRDEIDALAAAERGALAEAATSEPHALDPPRIRNLELEARQISRRNGPHWGQVVADFIRTSATPPRKAPQQITTQLQAALWLTENGVTSSEHLARVLGVNRRHGAVLLSRCRKIRTMRKTPLCR